MNDRQKEELIEDWEYLLANRPKVDLTKCVPGQKLLSKFGEIYIYKRKTENAVYPHEVTPPDGGYGSRTNEGWMFNKSVRLLDHDIIYVFPMEETIPSPKNIDSKCDLKEFNDLFNYYEPQPDLKVQWIKEFRISHKNLYGKPCGLAYAKFAVDNYKTFIREFEKLGEPPSQFIGHWNSEEIIYHRYPVK